MKSRINDSVAARVIYPHDSMKNTKANLCIAPYIITRERMTVKNTRWKDFIRKRIVLRLGNFQWLTIRYPRSIMMITIVAARTSFVMEKRSMNSDDRNKRFIDTAAAAAAGIGSPVKLFVYISHSTLFLSLGILTLKRTSRNTPHVEKTRVPIVTMKRSSLSGLSGRLLRIITAGATPKLTTSARESNIHPNSLSTLRTRAIAPSRKSAIIAKISSPETISRTLKKSSRYGSVTVTLKMINSPNESPIAVMMFGKTLIFFMI